MSDRSEDELTDPVATRANGTTTTGTGTTGADDVRPGVSACDSDCQDALERLEAYLDGELPGADVAEIAAHLSACYPCTGRATFEEQLRSIVRRGCVEHAPASLVERIRAHLVDLPIS